MVMVRDLLFISLFVAGSAALVMGVTAAVVKSEVPSGSAKAKQWAKRSMVALLVAVLLFVLQLPLLLRM